MQRLRQASKLVSVCLAFFMFFLSGPYQSAVAAIIGTEAVLNRTQGQEAREYVNSLITREDVQATLITQGIDPMEAKIRICSLSDAEVIDLAERIDQLPAPGGFFETFLIAVFLIFLILLFTDLAGYTDVFPFVKKDGSKIKDRSPTVLETGRREDIKASSGKVETKPDENIIIYFNHDSNELSQKAIEKLDRVAEFMAKNPEANVKIKGFSNSSGTSSDDQTVSDLDQMVSEIRATTVKGYLVEKGVDPARISTIGLGSQDSIKSNEADGKNKLRHRVEIEFNLGSTH